MIAISQRSVEVRLYACESKFEPVLRPILMENQYKKSLVHELCRGIHSLAAPAEQEAGLENDLCWLEYESCKDQCGW